MKLSHEEVINLIPQREPFLFIDEVLDYDEYCIIGKKKFIGSEPFFIGHYPNNPIVPGVILIETFAQTAAVLSNLYRTNNKKETIEYLVKVNQFVFKNYVQPGDEVRIDVSIKRKMHQGVTIYWGNITCNKKIITEGNISVILKEIVK